MTVYAGGPRAEDMVWVPGGTFRIGSETHYPEEGPARDVAVEGALGLSNHGDERRLRGLRRRHRLHHGR